MYLRTCSFGVFLLPLQHNLLHWQGAFCTKGFQTNTHRHLCAKLSTILCICICFFQGEPTTVVISFAFNSLCADLFIALLFEYRFDSTVSSSSEPSARLKQCIRYRCGQDLCLKIDTLRHHSPSAGYSVL